MGIKAPGFKATTAAAIVVVATTAAGAIAETVNLQDAIANPPEIDELSVLSQVGEAEKREPSGTVIQRGESLAIYFRSIARRNAKDFEGALEDLQRTLALDPDSLTLVEETAYLMVGSGQPVAGRQQFEEYLSKHNDNPNIYLRFSRFCELHHNGNAELQQRALDILKEAHVKFEDSIPVTERLVSMLLSLGFRGEAREIGVKLTEASSEDPDYWLRVAGMARNIWPIGANENNRDRINGLYEKARSLAPEDREVNGTVGDYYAATRQYEEAKSVYQSMIEFYPQALLEREKLVRVYRITKEKDLALKELEALVQIDANRPTTQKLLGEMHEELGNYGKAVDHLAALLKLGEPSLEDYQKLADLCYKAGRFDEALVYMKRATAMSTQSPEAARILAEAMLENGNFAEAVAQFEKTEQLAEKHDREALTESFYFNFSLAAAQAGDIPRAENLLRRSIDLVPDDQPELAAKSLNQLGYLWLEQEKNIEQAGINIQRALELEPDRPEYLDSLGWYHHLKGDNEKALEILLDAEAKLEAPDPTVHLHLAEVYLVLGKKNEAVDQLETAISLDPENESLRERLAEIAE
ncbi:MAG: tetratricopeptide repeat protein [Verrucomicrobiota bacterium]